MKQSAEMRSALDFFSVSALSLAVWPELAQLHVLRNWKGTEAYKNDIHLLPTELYEGSPLTRRIQEMKNSSCVELQCGGDSARSQLMGAQLG